MPRLEEALFDYLTNDPGFESLVGDRLFPFHIPEGAAFPNVTYGRVSAQRDYDYDPFESTNAFVRVRMGFHCWSRNPEEAMKIGEAVLLALSGYEGDMGGQLVGASFAVLEQDTYEGETKLYRRSLDFQILYEEDLTPSS